jgi:hypothetical protein
LKGAEEVAEMTPLPSVEITVHEMGVRTEPLQIKGEVNILRGEKHFNFKNSF